MRFFTSLTLILFSIVSSGQYASIAINETAIKRFAENSKGATLYAVIANEKDPADAALVNAVKAFWKAGDYKFISKTEYIDQGQKGTRKNDAFYLAEWYDIDMGGGANTLAISSAVKNIHSGVYTLSFKTDAATDAYQTDELRNKIDVFKLEFDLSATLTNTKEKIIDSYFDLMIKYFDHEVAFCKAFVSEKDVKKESRAGIVYFGDALKEIHAKDILLVKEQIPKTEAADRKKGKKVKAAEAVSQFDIPGKNVYVVYPEDVKLALNKGDKQVLIYSNGMLLSATDGSVAAANDNAVISDGTKKDGFMVLAISILVLSFGLATVVK